MRAPRPSARRPAGPARRPQPSRRLPRPKPLALDELVARKRLHQLRSLTQTHLAAASWPETFRLPSQRLFGRHLLDPTLHLAVTVCYLASRALLAGQPPNKLLFLLTFTCLFVPINYHLDSYRSFVRVNKTVRLLGRSRKLRQLFLDSKLGLEHNQRPLLAQDQPKLVKSNKRDSFHWINRILHFFWPYLSHLAHYELNSFLRDQIESGALAGSPTRFNRLLAALVNQLDTNILYIERCRLGRRAPLVTRLQAIQVQLQQQQQVPGEAGKTLELYLDVEYNGDMDIAVIYRYLCCCNSRLSLKDIYLAFKVKVSVGPVSEAAPYVGRISVTLLELPSFGYKGIEIFELAELKVVRRVVDRLLTEHLLQPKFVAVELADLLSPKAADKEQQPRSADRRQAGLAEQSKETETSGCLRLGARAILCGCMCSNLLMRCCQRRIEAKVRRRRRRRRGER